MNLEENTAVALFHNNIKSFSVLGIYGNTETRIIKLGVIRKNIVEKEL